MEFKLVFYQNLQANKKLAFFSLKKGTANIIFRFSLDIPQSKRCLKVTLPESKSLSHML